MSEVFDVIPYSIDGLKAILCSAQHAVGQSIVCKTHCIYFKEYFEKLEAKTEDKQARQMEQVLLAESLKQQRSRRRTFRRDR